MSQHPSLKSKTKGVKHRSVLKRFEKLKLLIEKEKWADESSIFNIPKIKVVKFKVKKEKAAVEATSETTLATGAAAIPGTEKAPVKGASPVTPGKSAASGKSAGAKKEEAKPKK